MNETERAPRRATMSVRWTGIVLAWLLAGPPLALAREALPLAADPGLDARVMHIAEELRCLVCQNETLADSQADLAVDLRQQIAGLLRQGATEPQVRDYMVQRYGEFVRYRPAFGPSTALLWTGPFLLLGLVAVWVGRHLRRRRPEAAGALDAADAARLAELLATERVGP